MQDRYRLLIDIERFFDFSDISRIWSIVAGLLTHLNFRGRPPVCPRKIENRWIAIKKKV